MPIFWSLSSAVLDPTYQLGLAPSHPPTASSSFSSSSSSSPSQPPTASSFFHLRFLQTLILTLIQTLPFPFPPSPLTPPLPSLPLSSSTGVSYASNNLRSHLLLFKPIPHSSLSSSTLCSHLPLFSLISHYSLSRPPL